MVKVRRPDGTVGISDLKRMALSPAHYRASVQSVFETSRDMRIGTIVHAMLLGEQPGRRRIVRFEGAARRGKEWEAFKVEHADAEIVTAAEWDEAAPIAKAVYSDPIARPMIEGSRLEHQVRWTDACGVECGTGGIDVVGAGFIADLKTTRSADPSKFARLACNLYYPEQMAFYARGARANGIDVSKGLYIIAVETSAPYPVTVFRLTQDMIDLADRRLDAWLEKLRACEESDSWPGYSQAIVDLEAPAWAFTGDDDNAEGDDA